jgi:hypothetical protein
MAESVPPRPRRIDWRIDGPRPAPTNRPETDALAGFPGSGNDLLNQYDERHTCIILAHFPMIKPLNNKEFGNKPGKASTRRGPKRNELKRRAEFLNRYETTPRATAWPTANVPLASTKRDYDYDPPALHTSKRPPR